MTAMTVKALFAPFHHHRTYDVTLYCKPTT